MLDFLLRNNYGMGPRAITKLHIYLSYLKSGSHTPHHIAEQKVEHTKYNSYRSSELQLTRLYLALIMLLMLLLHAC